MIQVANLRKAYGSLQAVDGISFNIEKGETFGLLGPNGAGKTTTLHMMMGALRPDTGTITIDGVADPTNVEARRKVGLAPQALALYEQLTAQENLAFFAKLYGLNGSRLNERVSEALRIAGLEDRKKDRVAVYSGGMKRRLNLAVALVHEPVVLFLDEPTVGVDPQSRNFLFDAIIAFAKQGRTILYTTHYMEEAARLCNRVAIMDHGKILALDTVPGLIAMHGGKAMIEVELETVPSDPATLPGKIEGKTLYLESDKPHEEVEKLLHQGLKMTSFKIDPPNLERVFLNLTGRRLRD